MYRYKTTKQFDKDVKRCQKRGLPIEKLVKAVTLLVENGKLPKEYRPHKLSGDYAGRCQQGHGNARSVRPHE